MDLWLLALALTWTVWAVWTAWPGISRMRRATPVFRRVEPASVHIKSKRKPEWALRQLILLKAHLPEAGCRTLALTFNRVFAHRGVSLSKSWVHAALRNQAHAVLLARKAIRAARPRAVALNHCWALDLTGRADESGCIHTVLGLLDHRTRRVLTLMRLPNKCAWTLLGHLCLAIARFGKPRIVRSDNERCFTGRVFSAGLKLLGIGHQRIDLHCPWQNGRIERFFGTLKGVLTQCSFASGSTLGAFLADFCSWYNELRPHQNLGGMTPLEAWEQIDPFHAPAPPKAITFVQAWDGLLCGFHIRR